MNCSECHCFLFKVPASNTASPHGHACVGGPGFLPGPSHLALHPGVDPHVAPEPGPLRWCPFPSHHMCEPKQQEEAQTEQAHPAALQHLRRGNKNRGGGASRVYIPSSARPFQMTKVALTGASMSRFLKKSRSHFHLVNFCSRQSAVHICRFFSRSAHKARNLFFPLQTLLSPQTTCPSWPLILA